MKHDGLLRARKNALDEFLLDEEDDSYEIAMRAIDLFIDYLEEDVQNAEAVVITSTGALEITSDNISTNE